MVKLLAQANPPFCFLSFFFLPLPFFAKRIVVGEIEDLVEEEGWNGWLVKAAVGLSRKANAKRLAESSVDVCILVMVFLIQLDAYSVSYPDTRRASS